MSESFDWRPAVEYLKAHTEGEARAFVEVLSNRLPYVAALTAERDALKTKNEQMDALMELACADVIFFHSQEHGPFLTSEEPRPPETISFSILVNDLFYPAADAEGFDISEAIPLRDVFRKEGMEGIIRWVQQKRDNLPLRPHVEARVKEQEGLRQQVAALKQKLAESDLAFNHANEVVARLEADVERLYGALLIYGRHRSCVLENPRSSDTPDLSADACSCGFRTALIAARTQPPAKEQP